MTINSDVTIFNLRIGADRREKFYATRIMGVSWYGTKGETVSGTDRKDKAKCVIRIPATATVEAGKQYISEEKYKKLSDEDVEKYWTIQKNAYIMRGTYEGEIPDNPLKSIENLVTITEFADNTIRGTNRTKHWRIGVA